jgi:IS6 family transposase
VPFPPPRRNSAYRETPHRPILSFKQYPTAAIVIAGIDLLCRVRKGQFNLGRLRLKDRRAPAVWNAVLAA